MTWHMLVTFAKFLAVGCVVLGLLSWLCACFDDDRLDDEDDGDARWEDVDD